MKTQGNPILDQLGRRLRLALIGGGSNSFIGTMHSLAARMDDRYEIVTGVVSSNPEKAKTQAKAMGFAPDRIYGEVDQMLRSEAMHEAGADVVAIMTPNNSHYPYAMAALELGFDVICDKPMTTTLEEAEALHAKVTGLGRVFCLTHNYTGYPLVRQARAMVAHGELGEIRLVQVEYVQGGKAREDDVHCDVSELPWRFDPDIAGPSLVLGDIGTHAHNLLRYITGLEVTEVSAEVGAIVPGRRVDDYAGVLMHMEQGVKGVLWVTQAAAGVENSLKIRVSGTKGSLEWNQELPQVLTFKPLGAPVQIRTPNGPGTYPFAQRVSRIVAGHPEGFPEAFANLYSDAAEAIAARLAGAECDPPALSFPNSYDGLMGVRFLAACKKSSRASGIWTSCS